MNLALAVSIARFDQLLPVFGKSGHEVFTKFCHTEIADLQRVNAPRCKEVAAVMHVAEGGSAVFIENCTADFHLQGIHLVIEHDEIKRRADVFGTKAPIAQRHEVASDVAFTAPTGQTGLEFRFGFLLPNRRSAGFGTENLPVAFGFKKFIASRTSTGHGSSIDKMHLEL